MLTNIEIIDCFIDLDNYEYSKGIYNLKKNLKYYIKMNAWTNYKTNLNLKMYNISSIPFSFIQIYECLQPNVLSKCEKNITEKINFEKINNSIYEATIEKENNLNKHLFLYIVIIPEYDINYMVAETTIFKKSKNKINTSELILIIIEILVIILMILYIIYLVRKCILSKSDKDLKISV